MNETRGVSRKDDASVRFGHWEMSLNGAGNLVPEGQAVTTSR